MANTTYAQVSDFTTRFSGGVNANSTVVQQLLNAAAQMVDGLTRGYKAGYEAFSVSASEARSFNDSLPENGVVYIDDLSGAPTLVTRGGTTVASTYYQMYPYNPANGPYTRLLFRADSVWPQLAVVTPSSWYNFPYAGEGAAQVVITGTWGYCAAANRPAVIMEATLRLAKQLYDEGAYTAKDMFQAVQNPSSWVDKSIHAMLSRNRLIRAEQGEGLFA